MLLLAFALLAGVAAATRWGWSTSKLATIGVYGAVGVFLAYGLTVLWRCWRGGRTDVPRKRIASAAAVTVVAVAIWLTYAIQVAPGSP